MDCKNCLKLNPSHEKAQLRAIQCCLKLGKAAEAITYCDAYLERNPSNNEVVTLKKEANNTLVRLLLSLIGLSDATSRPFRKAESHVGHQSFFVSYLTQM